MLCCHITLSGWWEGIERRRWGFKPEIKVRLHCSLFFGTAAAFLGSHNEDWCEFTDEFFVTVFCQKWVVFFYIVLRICFMSKLVCNKRIFSNLLPRSWGLALVSRSWLKWFVCSLQVYSCLLGKTSTKIPTISWNNHLQMFYFLIFLNS